MSNLSVERTIQKILTEDLSVEPALVENISAETPLLGRGIGLDSVEALRLALGLENAFDISVPDADLNVELFASFGALTEYVERKIAARDGLVISMHK